MPTLHKLTAIFSKAGFILLVLLLTPLPQTALAITGGDLNSIVQNTPFYDPTSGCSGGPALTSSGGGGRIFVMGDSLSVGMQAAGLQNKLSAANYTVTQIDATVGISILGSVPKIDAEPDKTNVIAADRVLIELGTNDANGTTVDAMNQKIQAMVQKIRTVKPAAQISWVTVHSAITDYSVANTAIKAQATTLNYQVIDWDQYASANFKPSDFDTSLGVHLTGTGYGKMADFVVKSLGPQSPIPASATLVSLPATATIDQKIAQTFIVGFAPSQATIAQQMVQKYHLGGIFILGNATPNDFNQSYFSSLNQAAGTPLLIASDEEGGQVQRFAGVPAIGSFPSAKEMAAMSDAAVEALGKKVGQGLSSVGVTSDLAPVLDLLTTNTNNADNLGNPAKSRSFSPDPNVIAAKAGAFAKGLKESSIIPVLKHFPGIGQLPGNTDTGRETLPALSQLQNDLLPYQTLANQNGAAVMLSNAYVPDWGNSLPTSLNPAAVSFLKGAPYNFTGIIMTDDLAAVSKYSLPLSAAVSQALKAGVDMPLFKYTSDADIQAAIDAVKAAVSPAVIDAVNTKILAFKNGQNAVTTSATGTCCSAASALSGNNNAIQVYNYLVGKGLSSAQAAGIVGNMISESVGVEPERLESHITEKIPADSIPPGETSRGWGIVQWTPSTKMINPTKAAGKDPNNLGVQVDFLWQELNSNEKGALASVQAATTPETAAFAFESAYERPQNIGASATTRQTQARAIYENATNGTPIPPSIHIESDSASGSVGGGGSGGCGGSKSDISAYKNPFRDVKGTSGGQVTPGRVDQGVDYLGTGTIYALGAGKVISVATTNSGWPGLGNPGGTGGAFILYQLSDGPAAGRYVYFAEDCRPRVTKDQGVTADTPLCDMYMGGTNIETGWAANIGTSTLGFPEYTSNGIATSYGQNFSQLMKAVGAPPGDLSLSKSLSPKPLPADWPTW